ncbi:MAG: aminotransferase class III-fold pyridoxal phosphate-dependent enzyme, partial [Pseudomonadota bacterium]
WYTTNDPATRFADLITQRAPGDLDHVFFTTGGSTAIETALRFVFFYNNVMGRPGRKLIVSRDGAYHGSTHLSAALNGRGHPAGAMDDTDPRVRHLPSPDPRNRRHGETEADFVRRLVGAFEDLIAEEGAETIAAFVGEPVMASGGVIVPPNGYFKAMSEACNRHGILFLADEVVTAFGRLGAVFASQEIFGVTPDLLTFAKGVTSGYFPLGGVLISARLIADLREAGANDAMFAHGLTYSSHPIGCAVAIRNLELLEAGVLDHVGAMIPHFQSRLAELRELPGVSDVRGLGLMACVEMKDGASPGDAAPIATEIDRHCQTLGLLVRPIGNLCVMSPPLIISAQQIDDLASILRTGISRATAGASFD